MRPRSSFLGGMVALAAVFPWMNAAAQERAWWGTNTWTGENSSFPSPIRPYSVYYHPRDNPSLYDEYALSFPSNFDPAKAYPVWIKFLPFFGSFTGIYHDTFAANYCDAHQVIYIGFAARAGAGCGYAGGESLGDNPEYGLYPGPYIRQNLKDLMNEICYLFKVRYFAFTGASMGGYSAFRIAADISSDRFGVVVASCPAVFFREWISGTPLIVNRLQNGWFNDRLVILMQGALDDTVPIEQTNQLDSYQVNRDWWEYHVIQGTGHEEFFFITDGENENWGVVPPAVSNNPNYVWDRVSVWEAAHQAIANSVLSPTPGWTAPASTSDWYIPRSLVEYALGQLTDTPTFTPTILPGTATVTWTPTAIQPSDTPTPTGTTTGSPTADVSPTPSPTNAVPSFPSLSQLLDASVYLEKGDIPMDGFQPPAAAIYVANATGGGSDSHTGLSIHDPLEHLHTAIEYANAHPETPLTIYLRGGVYYYKDADSHVDLKITRGNLYITAYQDESVIIRPYYWPGNPTNYMNERAFEFEGSFENLTFDNLQFEGWEIIYNPGSPFETPPLRNITIKNIKAKNFTRRDADPNFYRVFLETFYVSEDYYGPGKVIFDHPEGAHYQIEGLFMSNILVEGVDLAVSVGDENDANVKGLRISRFEVHNPLGTAGDSASDAFAIVNCYKVLIDHCQIENINDDGIDTKSFDVAVINCSVSGTGRNAVKFWRNGELINSILYDVTDIDDAAIVVQEGPFRMINSVLYHHPSGYAGVFDYNASQPSSLRLEIVNSVIAETHGFYSSTTNPHIQHNRFVNIVGDSPLLSGQIEANTTAALNALPNCSGNAVSSNHFLNPGEGNFALTPGSDWINAGTSSHVLLPSFDFHGNARIIGEEVDIGPIEFSSTSPTPIPGYDLWPDEGDGQIDAHDLLELLRTGTLSGLILFDFARFMQTTLSR